MPPANLEALRAHLATVPTMRRSGHVVSVTGLALRFTMPGVRVGDGVRVLRRGEPLLCEVVGFDSGQAVAMALGRLDGVGPDDEVEAMGGSISLRASPALLGRVLDWLGRPLDGLGELTGGNEIPVQREPPSPLARRPITRVFSTGVRVLDGLVTLGEGQRIGLFSPAGVGKSTLLGALARGADVDAVVVALVGERGREVGEFLEHALGDKGRRRSVVVVSTSDEPALGRVRAAEVATAYAEYFREEGARVLLLMDSLTRVARAQREVGLAAGEPPTRRGYPPSVFAVLPRLLERAGQGSHGSITAVYAVLVEGGDLDEPIADEARGLLDGHVLLDRGLAARGRFPAVDVVGSLSRVMDRVVSLEHMKAARRFRSLVSSYESKRELIAMGAYAKGSEPEVDLALVKLPRLEAFVAQEADEPASFEDTVERLQGAVRSP
jgi:type III secretion protein N (ATPase)